MAVSPGEPLSRKSASRSHLGELCRDGWCPRLVVRCRLRSMSERKRIPTTSKPTRGRTGRGPVTKPGYHSGRAPANKGRRLPTPVLSREEVGAVFDAFRMASATDTRDRALLWLAYQYRLKLVQLTRIDSSGYDPKSRQLSVPSTSRHPASTISIDSMTAGLLDQWLTARNRIGIRPFAPLFCTTVADSLGQPVSPSYLRGKLAAIGRSAGFTSV